MKETPRTQSKKSLSPESRSKLIKWLINGETGISSKTMAAVSMGERIVQNHGMDAPYDPSDFRRCYLLVEAIPEIKEFFPEIGKVVPKFKGILENWDELCRLYERDKNKKSSPELYHRIKMLREDRIEPHNVVNIINIKNAGYNADALIRGMMSRIEKNDQALLNLMNNRYRIESFDDYFTCAILYKGNNNAFGDNEIPMLLDSDLEFKLNATLFLKNKAKYKEHLACEVLKFIENGYFSTTSEEQRQDVEKARSYILKKFPKLASYVESDSFPRDRSFSSLPKTIKPEVKTRKRKAA